MDKSITRIREERVIYNTYIYKKQTKNKKGKIK